MSTFQFEHLRLDESLRRFLETFRLPGESAEITKIMQEFSGLIFKRKFLLNKNLNFDTCATFNKIVKPEVQLILILKHY